MHQHFDAAGEPAGRTVVTREPEWDDEQREMALAHIRYAKEVHAACGNHASDALDKTVARYVEHEPFVCEDCRAIDMERKAWHKRMGHSGDLVACDTCADEHFYIAKREHIPAELLS